MTESPLPCLPRIVDKLSERERDQDERIDTESPDTNPTDVPRLLPLSTLPTVEVQESDDWQEHDSKTQNPSDPRVLRATHEQEHRQTRYVVKNARD
jgi:hypothetical protein